MSTDTQAAVVPVPASSSLVIDRGYVGGAAMKARMDLILDVMKHVMKEDTDFGTVPGTGKPSLWQPGADKLCVAFQITPKIANVEDLTTDDEIRYRVTVSGIHQGTGLHLADGIGEASTNEEKYRWRRTYIKEEFEETSEDRRRKKWKQGYESKPNYFEMQVRTSPADLANTVLKMAVKRGKIAMVLAATGAAAIFTQDVEDLPEEIAKAVAADESESSSRKRPQRASSSGSARPATSASHKVSEPLGIKSVTKKPRDGKDPYWLIVTSDGGNYSSFEEPRAKELESFAGTDHKVRITYDPKTVNGREYRNLVTFVIADEPAAATAAAPSSSPAQGPPPPQSDVPADDIPWGGR